MNFLYEPLKICPLFEHIHADDFQPLFHCLQARVRSAGKDELLFSAGERPEYIGVVLSGSIYIIQEDYWGRRSILSAVEPGGIFGEAFACSKTDFLPVSVIVRSDCQILLISHERLLNPCASSCSFHIRLIQNLVKILAQKNIGLTQKIKHVSGKTTQEKIMSYLSSCAASAGNNMFEIPFNRQEMADYLSVERSALSSVLGKMREEGLIEFHKNKFRIRKSYDGTSE